MSIRIWCPIGSRSTIRIIFPIVKLALSCEASESGEPTDVLFDGSSLEISGREIDQVVLFSRDSASRRQGVREDRIQNPRIGWGGAGDGPVSS
jgi:hypothetical protein